jgi:DHA1 family multidrug resistance protein-like MFS transporter
MGIYGFNVGQLGIVFLCIIVGTVVGIVIYVSYVYFYLEPDIKKHGLRAQEHRLVPALWSTILLPVGIFWFGWTATASIHWIVSIIGITLFGIGAFILYVSNLYPSPFDADIESPDFNVYSCTYH